MRFREIYFTEEKYTLKKGHEVFVQDDKTPYVIKRIDGDVLELVDVETRKNTLVVHKDKLTSKQEDLFGGKTSTEPTKQQKFKRQYKNAKADAEQTSLF